MNSTLTLLHMPPTMHAQTHGQTRRRTCMVARTDAQTHACTDARTDAQTHGQTHRQTHGQTHRRTPAYACMFARTDAQTHVQTPWTRGTRARGSHRGCDGTVRAHGSREGTAALRQDRTRRKSARGRGNVGGEAREWDGLDRDNMSPQKSKLGKRDGCAASRDTRTFLKCPRASASEGCLSVIVLRGFLLAGAPALTAACSGLSSPGLSCPGTLPKDKHDMKTTQAGTTGTFSKHPTPRAALLLLPPLDAQ